MEFQERPSVRSRPHSAEDCCELVENLCADGNLEEAVELAESCIDAGRGSAHAEFGLRLSLGIALILSINRNGCRRAEEHLASALRRADDHRRRASGFIDESLWRMRATAASFWLSLARGETDASGTGSFSQARKELRGVRRGPAFVLVRLYLLAGPLVRVLRRVSDPFHWLGAVVWLGLIGGYVGLVPFLAHWRYGDVSTWYRVWRESTPLTLLLYGYFVVIGLLAAWPLLSRPIVKQLGMWSDPETKIAALALLALPDLLEQSFSYSSSLARPGSPPLIRTKRRDPTDHSSENACLGTVVETIRLLGPSNVGRWRQLSRATADWLSRH